MYAITYTGRYFPSSDIIDNIVRRNIDLNFQGKKFDMLISWKRWELSQTCVIQLLQSLIFANEWYRYECVLRDPNLNF